MDRAHGVYEFGDYRLDVARRTLTRLNGEPVELKPKVFDVLRCLVEHAGELVEKKTLLAAVWPDVVVEDHNLNKSVSMLRRTLGDDAEAQEFIATIPGRGYQFVRGVTSVIAHEQTSALAAPPSVVLQPARPATRHWLPTAAIAIAVVAASSTLLWQDTPRGSTSLRPSTHALLDARPAERLYDSHASPRPARTAIRLSPDGRTIVFTGVRDGVQQLFKRRLENSQATPIPGTEHARAPFFSPDGQWVGFWQAGRFKRSPLAGGPPVDIGAVDGGEDVGPTGVSWGANGLIVYGMPRVGGIWSIPADGGTAERITQPDPAKNENHRLPHVLPGGRAMVFTTTGLPGDDRARLVAHRFDTGEQHLLLDDAADARFLSSGHLLFMRRGTLMAAAFDAERIAFTGAPAAVSDDLMQAIHQPHRMDETFAGQYDAANGTLVFVPGGVHPPPRHELVWVGRDGTETPFPLATGPFHVPRLSPNGKLVAYFMADANGARDVWIYDVERRTARRATFEGGVWPLWSADGTRLIFIKPGLGLQSVAIDGGGSLSEFVAVDRRVVPSSWVGSTLLTVEELKGLYTEIWALSTDRPDHAMPVLQGDYTLHAPALSPDGRWLAYVSWETGSPDVYVQRYPQGGETVRVSTAGGNSPRWTRGGRELVFTRAKQRDLLQVLAVAVNTHHGFRFEPPRVLFEGSYLDTVPAHGYDVSPDGETFVMVKRGASEPFVTTMNLVLDWEAELENRLQGR